MSEPTRKEVIDAHKALEELYDWALEWAGTRAHSRYGVIHDALPPKPEPTMEGIEWDEYEHFLAEAEHPEHGKVVMIVKDIYNGNIGFLFKDEDNDNDFLFTAPENLTPTGKKYVLLEM